MYYSKWLLDSGKLIDPYQLHKKIWQLFPDKADEERSFLFRIEKSRQRCAQQILLQSAFPPQAVSNELLLLKKPKEIHFEINSGGRYRFMLCANPTKRINDKDGKAKNQGKVRVPLIDEAETVAWLKRQFEGSAEIDAVELIQKNLIHFHKSNKDQNNFGKIQTVTFLGMLTIIDSELLIGKIVKGIGPAKVFGCGLVTLAKI